MLLTHYAIAQELKISELKNWQLKGYAKSAERLGDHYSAIDYYQEYVKREPNDMSYSLKLAQAYYESKNYKSAKILYQKIYKVDHEKYFTALFNYAEILKTELNYDSAYNCFLEFRNIVTDRKERTLYSYLVNVEIESCDFALKNSKQKNNLALLHLNNSINKVNLESAPLIFNDSTMIYSSLRIDSIPIISSNEETNIPVNKFYTAKLQNNIWQGEFVAPEPFYNFDNENTANGVFSLDKQRFYFTKARRNWKNKIIGNLYVSHKKRGVWQKPTKLDKRINLNKYTSTQPAVSLCYDKNYEVIYFISDRPNGWGGMDIWYTVFDKSSGTYKKPINAGGYVNTPGDEVTPFYDNQNQTLYFSSNGLPGYGGYDIFKSKGWLVNWSPAENAGLPLNSSFDDIYYCKFKEEEKGFIVSNRDGALSLKNPNCCFDIFEFSIATSLNLKETQHLADVENTNKKGALNDSLTIVEIIKQSIDSSLVLLEMNRNETVNSENCIHNGTSLVIKNSDGHSNELTNVLDTFYFEKSKNQSFIFGNIYFEFNQSELTKESKKMIDSTLLKIMKDYPGIVVEIGAHTDHIGSGEYNLELSQKRAESVVKYLVNNGVEKERLVPVGYGENDPIVSSVDSNGKDIPEAREKNRRIEFKLLGFLSKL